MLSYFYWKLLHLFGLKCKVEPDTEHVTTMELFFAKGINPKNSILDVSSGTRFTSDGCH